MKIVIREPWQDYSVAELLDILSSYQPTNHKQKLVQLQTKLVLALHQVTKEIKKC